MAVFDSWSAGNTFTATDEDAVAQAINGSGWLQPCHYATTGAETYTIVSGSVTQLSGTTLDGGSPSVNDRILIKDSPASSGAGVAFSSQPGNGVYKITANSTNLSVARVYEMSSTPPTPYVPSAEAVSVMAGTNNGGQVFLVTTPGSPAAFTYGAGAIQWSPVTPKAGAGLTLSGTTLSLSTTAQGELTLAASSLQSAANVLTVVGGATVEVSSMLTGQAIIGNAGTPTIATLGGDIAIGATGTATIQGGVVGFSKLANLSAHSVIGNSTGSSTTPSAINTTTTGAASSVVMTDSSGNVTADAFIPGVTTTATAGGTTTLTVNSTGTQQFTGSAVQNCVLPDATTLANGQQYFIANRSSAVVTIKANGGSTLQALAAGSQCVLTLISNGASAGTWDVAYTIAGLTGTVTSVSGTPGQGFTVSVSNGTTTPAVEVGTSITGLLKGDGTGVAAAVSATDYAPATTGSSILKASSGGFANAVSGTDYAPPTSGSSALKGNGSGGFSSATLNDVGAPTANYSMSSFTFTNLATPTTSDEPATKGYVDTIAQGLSNKYSALAAVNTETLTISSGNVSQIAGTTVDGQSPNVNDYVLIINAPVSTGAAGGTTPSTRPANGLYLVTGNTTNLSVSRAAVMSGSNNPSGAYVFVEAGSTWGSGGFVVTTPASSGAFTYGSGNIAFVQFTGAGEITAGTGIAKSGNTLSLSLTGGTAITISGATVGVTNSSIGPTQLSATGSASSSTYLRGDNSWQNFNTAAQGAFSAGTAITLSGGAVSVTNASIGPTQLSATGTPSSSTFLRGDNTWASISSTLSGTSLSVFSVPTAGISWGSYGITSLANPASAQDAATKIYVDSAHHPSCRVATTGVETFTVTSGSVTQISGTTMDGISPSVNDRVLIKDAPATTGTGSVLSAQPGNGIYVVTSNTTNLSVSRVSDMSSGGSSSTPAGSSVQIMAGTANTSTNWIISSPSSAAAFTYGTTNIQWTPFINTGNVITRSGNTVSVSSMSTGQAVIGNAGTPTITTLTGDISLGATGTVTIGSAAVSLSKMANLAANSVIGNTSGSGATPTAVALTTSATSGAVALRDSNTNLSANAFIPNAVTTATAAGTTTLTVSSSQFQQFTGASTQICVLPNATTLAVGQQYLISNTSTGNVTVQANGGGVLQVMATNTHVTCTLISNSGSAGTWDLSYSASGGGSGGTWTVSTSSATSLTLSTANQAYAYTGSSTATWTLPAVSGNTGVYFQLYNRGTATVTVQRAGSDNLYSLGASTTSIALVPGGSVELFDDGTYWLVLPESTINSYSTTIGDGSTTAITVTHNLGTANVVVGVYNTSTGAVVNPDIVIGSINTVTLTFATAPTSGQYTAIVLAGAGSIAVPSVTSTGITDSTTLGRSLLTAANATSAQTAIEGFSTTTTAAGTTTLTVSSTLVQVFTGSTTQTVKLPTTSVAQGAQYMIVNQSTGAVTVQSSGANAIYVLAGGTSANFTAVVVTPTTAANWSCQYWGALVAQGKAFSASNSLTLAGTDGTTMTFPGSSDTVVTLGASQTLTSKTLTAPTITGYTETVQTISGAGSSQTLSLSSGTVMNITLTSATACTFTMPSAVAGQSFMVVLKQPASGTATSATFTSVKWNSSGTPTITATLGKADLLTFVSDGTDWYGSYSQGYTY